MLNNDTHALLFLMLITLHKITLTVFRWCDPLMQDLLNVTGTFHVSYIWNLNWRETCKLSLSKGPLLCSITTQMVNSCNVITLDIITLWMFGSSDPLIQNLVSYIWSHVSRGTCKLTLFIGPLRCSITTQRATLFLILKT